MGHCVAGENPADGGDCSTRTRVAGDRMTLSTESESLATPKVSGTVEESPDVQGDCI